MGYPETCRGTYMEAQVHLWSTLKVLIYKIQNIVNIIIVCSTMGKVL